MTETLVHGGMKYRCEKCGESWFMQLEIGVEDHGKNGKPHQPCPFIIKCPKCGGTAMDISGYLPLPNVRLLFEGMPYFAYDGSGADGACGKPIYGKRAQAGEGEHNVHTS